ncbi:uncharacterized protein LOC123312803 [Coccinella septempunctata]|uniref:uncharacterized protein LOC123312803 n=1 Tax=Coccinella septempunctata TaxID=41139 RepID=UPI001D072680|nr:uncharacterized protein LOC123312803 [Coccinella septempunctata]
MKWIYSILFLILGVVYADEVEKVEPSAIQQFLQQRCYKYAKEGDAYDQLVGLSFDFYKYAEYTATFLPDHIDHFCKNERPILKLKLKDVNKQMLKCLASDEKFLPQFVQDTFHYFMEFLCANEGSSVRTFFSTHGKECRGSLSRQNATDEVGACFSRVFLTVNDKGFMTKDAICSDVGFVNGCFSGILDKYCPDFAAFKELNKRFFTYVNKPCSGCIFGVNNMVTFLCVLAALFYKKLF